MSANRFARSMSFVWMFAVWPVPSYSSSDWQSRIAWSSPETVKNDSTGASRSRAWAPSGFDASAPKTISLAPGFESPASCASRSADWPTSHILRSPSGSKAPATNCSVSASDRTAAPCSASLLRISSATASSTTRCCSEPHITPLSNPLEAITACAAASTSASGATQHGALPAPTPIAGVPDE